MGPQLRAMPTPARGGISGRLRFAIRIINRNLVSIIAILALGGCSFVDIQERAQLSYQSVPVNAAVWNSVIPGHTDEQWVLRYLGQPAAIREGEKGQRIFIYPLTERSTKQTTVFLFYSKQSAVTAPLEKQVVLHQGKVSQVLTYYPQVSVPPTDQLPMEKAGANKPSTNTTEKPATPGESIKPVVPTQAANAGDPQNPYSYEGDPFEHPWP